MALKKSELYSSLWASCDELRGGMDASQYKDYVLSLLFIKYISDKYAGVPYAPITIPEGASFADMVALKGKPDIGDQINKKIIAPLAAANQQLSQADFPDFNSPEKLGDGQERAQRLANLIAIFESPSLDFSKNRAEGDDILGDAYEYLMRHFATESGKSKGQFYTPAEVSRIMAQVIGIKQAKTSTATTVYDPTCGSGSLLLKVGDEAGTKVTLYGQEKDAATSGLARMNMILHDNPTAAIVQGNTLTDPKFKDGEAIKQFDFVVANPPFSDKRWSTGLDPLRDPHDRFKGFGIPPAKQGDYAYLLHIIRSLKTSGAGACILPHGVLFRGNAEADIRRALVRKGYIKGIIGLPPNLFYGTGIPACIVVVDKKEATARKGIFMIDASQGFTKDGPKNRLRAQDIHKIVDAFTRTLEIGGYSRMVPFEEIERNEFNLNLPRYIDSQKVEDRQDIEGHLKGGIPEADIDALQRYWDVCPSLRSALFKPNRPGYVDLAVEKAWIKQTIFGHPEFAAFIETMNALFSEWRDRSSARLKKLKAGFHPKELIFDLSEGLLAHYSSKPLIDKYDVYQHLMTYWADVMQDDCYLIAADGWKAETHRIIERDKKGKERDKGWTCDLIPKELIVARYFAKEQCVIDELATDLETVSATIAELEEEHGGEEGVFLEFDKINKGAVSARYKEAMGDKDAADEIAVLGKWLELAEQEAYLKKRLREEDAKLDAKTYAKYPRLTDTEIKILVAEDKWLTAIEQSIRGELERISRLLADRVYVLAERYEITLPNVVEQTVQLERLVSKHILDFLSNGGRLSGFSGSWGERSFAEIFEFYPTATNSRADLRDSGDAYYVHYGDVHTRVHNHLDFSSVNMPRIDKSKCKNAALLKNGDWIMVDASEDLDGVGKAVEVIGLKEGERAVSGLHTYLLRERKPTYIAGFKGHLGQSNQLHRQYMRVLTGMKVFGVSKTALRDLQLPVPEVPEQKAITEVLSDMDAEIAALEMRLAKAKRVKEGMLQSLLVSRSGLA